VKSRLSPANSCRIRTSEKRACNPFRIRTYRTQDLKPFGIRTYRKGWGEGVLFHRSVVVLPRLKSQMCFWKSCGSDCSPLATSHSPILSGAEGPLATSAVLLPRPKYQVCPPNACRAFAAERSKGSARSEFRGTFPQAEQDARLVGWVHHISTCPDGGWAEVAESIST
jgi:hypothetical protein